MRRDRARRRAVGLQLADPGTPGRQGRHERDQRRAAPGGFGPAPGELRTARVLPGRVVATLGVVSSNAYRHLPRARARADWQRLTARDDVDLVGWQEAKSPAFRALAPRYRARGFATWRWPDPDGPISLAFSWRPAVLTLLDVDVEKVHRGGYPRETDDPFPARWVVTAQFRHRATGLAVTLLNTHVNQGIETGDGFADNLDARFARGHRRASPRSGPPRRATSSSAPATTTSTTSTTGTPVRSAGSRVASPAAPPPPTTRWGSRGCCRPVAPGGSTASGWPTAPCAGARVVGGPAPRSSPATASCPATPPTTARRSPASASTPTDGRHTPPAGRCGRLGP